MERVLPTVKIVDTDFIVDIHNSEFRQQDRSQNKIPFTKVFDSADGVIINYDKDTKNVYEGNWISFLQADHTESVHLPPFIELDRIGVMETLSKKEWYDHAEQLSKQDHQKVEKSVARVLPKVEIEGTVFFSDMRLSEFRNVDNPLHRIPHGDLLIVESNKIGLMFDPLTGRGFSGTREQFDQRNDLRLVEIPNLVLMNSDVTGKTFTTTSYPARKISDPKILPLPQPKRRGSGL